MESQLKFNNGPGTSSKLCSEKPLDHTPTHSVDEGEIDSDVEGSGTLHRTLTPRLIHVCTISQPKLHSILITTGNLSGFQCRKWFVHSDGEGSRRGRPRKHVHRLFDRLHRSLGQLANIVRDDDCVSHVRQLHRLRRSMG